MKQIENKSEIVPLIKSICLALLGHANDNEMRLMLGTWAAENGAMHRRQIGGGPAKGLWQMEPATAEDIFVNYLARKPIKCLGLMRIWFDLTEPYFLELAAYPYLCDLERHLEKYDDFACAMARLKYLRDPDPIPESIVGQASYWKRVYNTAAGRGTVEHYLSQWVGCGCEEMLACG